MKKVRKLVSLFLLAIVVATASVACGKKNAKIEKNNNGISISQMKKLPELEGVLLNGKKVDNSILKNSEYTLINVWSAHCGPCIDEISDLEKISKEYKSRGLQVIGIIAGGKYEKVEAYKLLDYKKVFYDNIVPTKKFMEDFIRKEKALPYTLIVNKEGEIKKFIIGSLPYEGFQKILNDEIKLPK